MKIAAFLKVMGLLGIAFFLIFIYEIIYLFT